VAAITSKLDGDTVTEGFIKVVRSYISSVYKLEPLHLALVQKIQLCPYVFIKLQADIGIVVNGIVLYEKGAAKLEALEARFESEKKAYESQLERWQLCIDRTKKRIEFLPAGSRPKQMQLVNQLSTLVVVDPFNKTYSGQLVEINVQLNQNVAHSEKIRIKNEETARLIAYFIASEAKGSTNLGRKPYSGLREPYKHLIRVVRQGQSVDSASGLINGVTYCWDAKPHKYSDASAPKFRQGKAGAREYRLFLSTATSTSTTKMVGFVSCGITGERITSIGISNTDDMVFFHCRHPSSGAYEYGIITNLPCRRDKTAAAISYLPPDFPDAPAPVIP
jgi:hypothetical protein